MENVNVKKVLPNGYKIVEIISNVKTYEDKEFVIKKVKKYALADDNGVVVLKDVNGNLVPITYFDNYKVDKAGNIIIGVKKEGKEVYDRLIHEFDITETLHRTKTNYHLRNGIIWEDKESIWPSKTIDDIIPKEYYFNYGVINKEGILSIYPVYDYACFANENSCILGNLAGIKELKKLIYGYADIITGEFITPIEFKTTGKFYNKRAAVSVKRKGSVSPRFGYVDRDKVITDVNKDDQYAAGLHPMFHRATDFKKGVAKVCIVPGTILTRPSYIDVDVDGNHKGKAYTK